MATLTHLRRLAALVGFGAALFAPAAAHAGYVLTEFARPGAASTSLFDVNNAGAMVGYSTPGAGPTDFAQGFVYQGGVFTTLSGPAGALQSAALGISDGGRVVGSFSVAAGVDGAGNPVLGASQGFIYDGGGYTTFNIAGAIDTFLRGISPDGRYVSGYFTSASVPGTGFVFDTATGSVVTVSTSNSLLTIAQGINSSYVVVGSDILGTPPGTRPGFLYDITTATRTDAAIAGALSTAIRSIDDVGILAGWFRDALGDIHGFVGSVGSFEQIDFTGAISTFVEGSNNEGVLVGNFLMSGRDGAFVAVQVPEPGSLLLAFAALAAAASTGRVTRRARMGGA